MVRPVILGLAAIPGVAAVLLIAVPMLTQTEIPYSAANPDDRLELEYARHHLATVSFGITDRVGSQKSEILRISEDGAATYALIEGGVSLPEKRFALDGEQMLRLTAFVKETGIASIPADSFPVREGSTDYLRSVLDVTLNGQHRRIIWPEQNATDAFVPPLLAQLEEKLDGIVAAAGE